ncbi:hypothetical protein [Streptomyces sp. SudanB91_2054]|uniref:hypothetical protein n=1 Tax=Streptomyces sp. SudanB91_2054 TaxID=3035278 RepID=UPI0036D9E759
MTSDPNLAAARVQALAEQLNLSATLQHVGQALAENRRETEALDRIEAAAPEFERLERLYPGRSTTRELLTDAGLTPASLGLQEEDPELIDKWMAEEGIVR